MNFRWTKKTQEEVHGAPAAMKLLFLSPNASFLCEIHCACKYFLFYPQQNNHNPRDPHETTTKPGRTTTTMWFRPGRTMACSPAQNIVITTVCDSGCCHLAATHVSLMIMIISRMTQIPPPHTPISFTSLSTHQGFDPEFHSNSKSLSTP